MNFWMCLQVGLREIWEHRFRSLLSMLGIVLGVSSLIATLGLTAGMERGIREIMSEVGGLERVEVEKKDVGEEMADFWAFSPGITMIDAVAIRESVPLVSDVSPSLHHGAPVSSDAGETERFRIQGVWPEYQQAAQHVLKAGRFICEMDEVMANRVAVVGSDIAEFFYPEMTPEEVLGEPIYIDGAVFTIVGILKFYEADRDRRRREARGRETTARDRIQGGYRSGGSLQRKNEVVLVPLAAMFHELRSGLLPEYSLETVILDELEFRVDDLGMFKETLDQVRRALLATHRGVDDFEFDTREEWFASVESGVEATRLSGGLIAAIALLVGGIGIANIMLASITERVREIGIRRAIGARGRDIFIQIIIESTSVSLIGGVLGILAGVGLMQLLILISPGENMPVLTWMSVIFSVAFAFLAGILSGLYPAFKASKLDPIIALRYE